MSYNSHKRQFICSVTELFLNFAVILTTGSMNTTRYSTGRDSFSNTWWTAIFLVLIITVSDPLNVPSTKCWWGNGQRSKTNFRCYKTNHARRKRPSCFLNHILQFCDCKWWGVIKKTFQIIQPKDEGRCSVYFFVIQAPVMDEIQVLRKALHSMAETEGFEVKKHEIRLHRLMIIVLNTSY